MFDGSPPPPPPVADIIVTARALDDPASDRAFSVERIDRNRLHIAARTQLDEILKQVPGLQLFRRSDSRSGHPTSQGVTLRALGGNASSRALLILDGVPQADPFGGWINWPAYDAAALAEVRVIRGGGSVVHGPGALAGVIEMVSGVDRGLAGGVFLGSRDSVDARLHLSEQAIGSRIAVSARGARGDGFVPVTRETRGPADQAAPYKEANVRAHWIGPLSGDVELQLSANGFTDRRDRGLAFTANRTDGADAALRLVGRGRWQWSALGYAQWREFESSFASASPGRASAARVSLQDSVPSRALGAATEARFPFGSTTELRFGADLRQTQGESRELFSFVAGEPTRRRTAGGKSLTSGAFGEATIDLRRLTLSGGIRLDRWAISDGRLNERVIASDTILRDERFGDRSGWLPTARFGARLETGRDWSLRAAAYRGWRLPTLNELFRPFRAGLDATAANPLLDPERLIGVEAGVQYRRGGLGLSATAFHNRLRGAIANVTLGQGPGVFPGVGFVAAGGEFRERRNLDAVTVRGIEASAEWTRGAWSAQAGASLVDPRVEGDGPASALDGLRPAQTPRLALSGTLAWERGRRALALTLRRTGAQFEDDLNERRLPPATTVDAFAGWPLGRRLQLVVRAENLLDELVVAGIGGDGAVERATPRTLWLGLRFAGSRGLAR